MTASSPHPDSFTVVTFEPTEAMERAFNAICPVGEDFGDAWAAACAASPAPTAGFVRADASQEREALRELVESYSDHQDASGAWGNGNREQVLKTEARLIKALSNARTALSSTPATVPQGDSKLADSYLKALLNYTGGFYSVAMEHGMKRGETANAIAHVESAARALHRLATTPQDVGVPEGIQNFTTHRASWRKAIEFLMNLGGEDKDYWSHELRAYDRSMIALDNSLSARQPLSRSQIFDVVPASIRVHADDVLKIVRAIESSYWLAATPNPPTATVQPIDMVLFCPNCGKQHIDAPSDMDELLRQERERKERMLPKGLIDEIKERVAAAHDESLDEDHRGCRHILMGVLQLINDAAHPPASGVVERMTEDQAVALVHEACGYINPECMPPEWLQLVRVVEAHCAAIATRPLEQKPVEQSLLTEEEHCALQYCEHILYEIEVGRVLRSDESHVKDYRAATITDAKRMATAARKRVNPVFARLMRATQAQPEQVAQDRLAQLREAMEDAADEYSKYIVEDTAHLTIREHMLNAFDAARASGKGGGG